jgi:hypothetical protein
LLIPHNKNWPHDRFFKGEIRARMGSRPIS